VETVDIIYRPEIQLNKTANLSFGSTSTMLSFEIEVSETAAAHPAASRRGIRGAAA